MQAGRRYNKSITAVDGAGTAESAATVQRVVAPPGMRVTTASPATQFAGETESQKTLTGPGDGDYVSSPDIHPYRWGHTAPSGSRFEINDSSGSERIEVVHHSGAAVVIDPDGGVFITSTSARGGGISAAKGDFYIHAGGDLVLEGKGSLSVKTPGDLVLDVGGTLMLKCAAYSLVTKAMDETVDGSASRSVTNDQSQVIGGINRLAVAGDNRKQVSGSDITDVGGSSTGRVDGDATYDVGGSSSHTIGGSHNLHTKGSTQIRSDADTKIDSGGELVVKTTGTSTIDSGHDIGLTAGSNFLSQAGGQSLTASGSGTIVSSAGTMEVNGNTVSVNGPSVFVDGYGLHLTGSDVNIDGSTVNINTGTLNAPVPTGSSGGAGSPQVNTQGTVVGPQGPEAADDVEEAQVMEAKDIVDTLTSVRKYPEYPGNGVLESADRTTVGMISYAKSPQAEDVYNEYSGGNQGNMYPTEVGGSYETLSDTPMDRPADIPLIESDIEVPSRYDSGTKISKYFTLGQYVNAPKSDVIPAESWDSVVQNFIKNATNVMDPIIEKFPDAFISCAYRKDSGNHITGRSVDVQVNGRSLAKHAEIARFARDNLPVDQVLLERSGSGYTHVHLRVATGSGGSPTVWTCADKECNSYETGINVEYLVRRGAKG